MRLNVTHEHTHKKVKKIRIKKKRKCSVGKFSASWVQSGVNKTTLAKIKNRKNEYKEKFHFFSYFTFYAKKG